MESQLAETSAKAITLAKSGDKTRALNMLRHKKYLNKELEKVSGAEIMLVQVSQQIEQANFDVQMLDAMKQGDQVLKELRSQVSAEDFQEIYEGVQEQQEIMDKEREMFGEMLDQDQLLSELEQLEAAEAMDALPSVPGGFIATNQAVAQPEAQEEEEPVVEKKRKLVAS